MSTTEQSAALTDDERRLAELGLRAEAEPRLERLPELRDLVHDHLGPGRLLHDLRPGVEQRRARRDLVGLADHLRADPDRRVLDGRARLVLPDRRRASTGGPPASAAASGAGSRAGSTSSASIAVVASVDYAAAGFANYLFSLYDVNIFGMNFADAQHILGETFLLFVLILGLHTLINIFSSPLVARLNSISVWWHVLGVIVIIGLLIFVPGQALERELRLHRDGSTTPASTTGPPAAACSGSTSCRSASC